MKFENNETFSLEWHLSACSRDRLAIKNGKLNEPKKKYHYYIPELKAHIFSDNKMTEEQLKEKYITNRFIGYKFKKNIIGIANKKTRK